MPVLLGPYLPVVFLSACITPGKKCGAPSHCPVLRLFQNQEIGQAIVYLFANFWQFLFFLTFLIITCMSYIPCLYGVFFDKIVITLFSSPLLSPDPTTISCLSSLFSSISVSSVYSSFYSLLFGMVLIEMENFHQSDYFSSQYEIYNGNCTYLHAFREKVFSRKM